MAGAPARSLLCTASLLGSSAMLNRWLVLSGRWPVPSRNAEPKVLRRRAYMQAQPEEPTRPGYNTGLRVHWEKLQLLAHTGLPHALGACSLGLGLLGVCALLRVLQRCFREGARAVNDMLVTAEHLPPVAACKRQLHQAGCVSGWRAFASVCSYCCTEGFSQSAPAECMLLQPCQRCAVRCSVG